MTTPNERILIVAGAVLVTLTAAYYQDKLAKAEQSFRERETSTFFDAFRMGWRGGEEHAEHKMNLDAIVNRTKKSDKS